MIDPQAERQDKTAGQNAGENAAGAKGQGCESIPGFITDLLILAAPQPLHGDRDDEHRDGPVSRGWQVFHDSCYLHKC